MRIEEAFPAIVSKTQFRRVNGLMRSRAPRVAHPRRVASSYLLSGLVKCNACNGAGTVPWRHCLRHRPGGRVRGHGPRRRRAGALPWSAGPGHEPLRHRAGRLRGASPAHRKPAPAHRGDGGGAVERRAAGRPRPRPGGLLRPAPRAHRLPGLLRLPARRRGGRRRYGAAAAPLRHRQPAQPPLRRGRRPAVQRGVDHRLRPAAAGAGASARRGDGLHRDGVGRHSPGPQAPPAGGGRGVVDHAAPIGQPCSPTR